MNAFAKVDKKTFLRFAAQHAEQRFEYVRGRIVEQMNGGTKKHGQVTMRVAGMLMSQLNDADWSIIVDRSAETSATIRNPDVVVEPATGPGDSLATSQPVLVVEVLSPSTTDADLDIKPDEYLTLASLDAYIVASQDERPAWYGCAVPKGGSERRKSCAVLTPGFRALGAQSPSICLLPRSTAASRDARAHHSLNTGRA